MGTVSPASYPQIGVRVVSHSANMDGLHVQSGLYHRLDTFLILEHGLESLAQCRLSTRTSAGWCH
jgi:hypothetical protein